ncbi:hypothetical protein F5Y08DRAFT_25101 [Xylaria arbuscula]|nr:hypothetical protein F5Y08DRAFT_25101 [Xylaria arbuscula]
MSQRADNHNTNSTASTVLKSPKELLEILTTQLASATGNEKEHLRLLLDAALSSMREEDALKAFSGGGAVENKYEVMTLYNHNPHPSPDHAKWSEFQDPVAEEKRLEGLGKTRHTRSFTGRRKSRRMILSLGSQYLLRHTVHG